MSEGKYWVFTDFELNEDYSFLEADYVIYGVEVCPETGRKHHQGYAEFKTNRKLKRLKSLGPNKFHWETRKGSQSDAVAYSMKDGVWFQFGELKIGKQGKRTDLEEVRQLVKGGAGMKDIVEVANSFQAIRMAEVYLKYNEIQRDWAPEVHWLWGPTGSGKTRKAVEMAGADYWISARNLKWWEGYDAHKTVIIDDFRKDFCTFHELLRILDRYPYRLEVKGASRQLLAKVIIITSCYPPDQVYETREDVAQLLRRINFISEMRLETEVGGNTKPQLHPAYLNL